MKDGTRAFADEVTLLRQELLDLKRSSLTNNEAKTLNHHVAQGVAA